MNEGYVKLYRKSINNPLFSNPKVWHFWTYCLIKANHKPTKFVFSGVEYTIDRGEFITGRAKASKETGLSEREIRTSLTFCEKLGMIKKSTSKSTSRYTVLVVVNYGIYQQRDEDGDQQGDQQATSKRPASDQQATTYKNEKNVKNVKNEKNENKKRFVDSIDRNDERMKSKLEIFERFWKAYPDRNGKKIGKEKARVEFMKLTEGQIELLRVGIVNFKMSEMVRSGIGIPDAERFLRKKQYLEWQEPETIRTKSKSYPVGRVPGENYRY